MYFCRRAKSNPMYDVTNMAPIIGVIMITEGTDLMHMCNIWDTGFINSVSSIKKKFWCTHYKRKQDKLRTCARKRKKAFFYFFFPCFFYFFLPCFFFLALIPPFIYLLSSFLPCLHFLSCIFLFFSFNLFIFRFNPLILFFLLTHFTENTDSTQCCLKGTFPFSELKF